MSPFDPWLSTYPRDGSSGPLPERPWWRLGAAAIGKGGPSTQPSPRLTYPLTRIDADHLTSGRIRVSVPPPPVDEEDVDAYIFGHVVAAVDAYDDAHPRPVPPVLPTQVWAGTEDGAYFSILTVGSDGFAIIAGTGQFGAVLCKMHPSAITCLSLVAGPHAPWAPRGWRP